MTATRRLTREQERQRIQGLRRLARIIARHYLANPDLYDSGWRSADAGTAQTEIAA